MATILPFLTMTETEASRLRELTLAEENRLDPRLVAAGAHAGRYVLPRRVMFDDAFADHRDAFALMTEVNIDADLAWPASAEEEQG